MAEWAGSLDAHRDQGSSYLPGFIGSGLTHSSFTVPVTFPLGLHYQKSIREREAYTRAIYPAAASSYELYWINKTTVLKASVSHGRMQSTQQGFIIA